MKGSKLAEEGQERRLRSHVNGEGSVRCPGRKVPIWLPRF